MVSAQRVKVWQAWPPISNKSVARPRERRRIHQRRGPTPKCDTCGCAWGLCGHEQKRAVRGKIAEAAQLGYDMINNPSNPLREFNQFVRDRDGDIFLVKVQAIERPGT